MIGFKKLQLLKSRGFPTCSGGRPQINLKINKLGIGIICMRKHRRQSRSGLGD